MSLQFYLGRSGMGKSTAMYQEINEMITRDPNGPPVIVITPDQMTFQVEQQLVRLSEKGMTRAQVYSFPRLAWKVFQETGGAAKTALQKTGKQMLIRKVISEQRKHFRLYETSSYADGFIDQVDEVITEWKTHNVSKTAMRDMATELESSGATGADRILTAKLQDLLLIWEEMDKIIGDRYIGSEEQLFWLTEKVASSAYLAEAVVYIDGFHRFTPQELSVVGQLLQYSQDVRVALTLDDLTNKEDTHPAPDMFRQTAKTYYQLSGLAEEHAVAVEKPYWFNGGAANKHEALQHLERFMENRSYKTSRGGDAVTVKNAVNRRTEVEECARDIAALVRDHNYRYEDIAVVARNPGDYNHIIETVFQDYRVPVFMDETRPVLNHPAVEFIRSALETIAERWRYESVFRTFKTDMLFDVHESWTEARKQVDFLENYVLARNVKEKDWKSEEQWVYRYHATNVEDDWEHKDNHEIERDIHQTRMRLSAPLFSLQARLKKARTVREKAGALFTFLEELRIPEKLEMMRDDCLHHNRLEMAREHEQIWDMIVDLLEQMVEVAGDDKAGMQTFQQMMEAGFTKATFSIVPPSLDQVTAADMERSRLLDIKVVYLLGVNEGVLPAALEESSMLQEGDRAWLEQQGIELEESGEAKLLNENFLIYRTMSLPSDRLIVSYPMADEEGKRLQPSIVIQQLLDMFPDQAPVLIQNEPGVYSKEEQLHFVNASMKTMSFLIGELERCRQGEDVAELWWSVYNVFVKNNRMEKLTKSLFYRNEAVALSRETTRELYGRKMKTSVSRMEQYEACAFRQFASYGLKLKERQLYKLEAPDIGQLFHAALKDVTKAVYRDGRTWEELSEQNARDYAEEAVHELAPAIQRQILLSNSRHQYLLKKLEETVQRASMILSQQAKSSRFSPIGLEVGFGPSEEIPPLLFELSDGTQMEVAGRIDRVDQAVSDSGVLLRVIDYKSSAKDLRPEEVFFGLALQMLVYLDVVLSFSEEWLGTKADPAGVLYFNVHNPIIQAGRSWSPEDIEQEMMKQFRMKGILPDDPGIAKMMDERLEAGADSFIVPARLNKGGGFNKQSPVVSKEQFERLRGHIREKIRHIGEQLRAGDTSIQPFQMKQKKACDYCEFHSVCQFDRGFPGNEFRSFRSGGMKWETLFQEEENDESEDHS